MYRRKNIGKRIRSGDKWLIYKFAAGSLITIFVSVFALLNSVQFCRYLKNFELLNNGFSFSIYNFITIFIAAGACMVAAFLFLRYNLGYNKPRWIKPD